MIVLSIEFNSNIYIIHNENLSAALSSPVQYFTCMDNHIRKAYYDTCHTFDPSHGLILVIIFNPVHTGLFWLV